MKRARIGRGERRWIIAAAFGTGLLALALASDFLVGSFWQRHSMLTSLLANLLVATVAVALINEVLERRARRRWNLVAQSAMFALVQSARLTWTGMVELLGLTEVSSGTVQSLLDGARVAIDRPRVSEAATTLLQDPGRRNVLQLAVDRLSGHADEVIARWASVMVGAAPYADLLDRHVELQGRLEWLSAVLAHKEPPPDQGGRERRLTRASVGSERADEVGDEWIHDMIVSITVLATHLDYESREMALSLAPVDWWMERMKALAG